MIWWYLYMPMMAQAAQPAGDKVSVVAVTAIIGAVFTGLAGLLGKIYGEKKAREVSISDQPLRVQMEEAFVTRREFEGFRGEVRADVAEMKGMWREALAEMKAQQKALTQDIKQTAENAYNGRQKLWEKVNDSAERLKSVEDRTKGL